MTVLLWSVDRVVTLSPMQKLYLSSQYLFWLLYGLVAAVDRGDFRGDLYGWRLVWLYAVACRSALWQGIAGYRLATICMLWGFYCWHAGAFTIFAGVVPQLARLWLAALRNALPDSQPWQLPRWLSAVFGVFGRDVLLVDSREAALFLAEAPDGVALAKPVNKTHS